MDPTSLKNLLQSVRSKAVSIEEALERLKSLPFDDLGFARVDHHRSLRCGFPEVVFCEGKTTKQVVAIATSIVKAGNNLLATRAETAVYKALSKKFPDAQYNELGRTVVIKRKKRLLAKGLILVVTGGTSDIPVAEEARVTAEVMDNPVKVIYDAGVAGIHRLLRNHDELRAANVLIVVAGMEGALASVVGGLVDRPVIAVPTSVGYGASFGGVAALLSMLNSCASGVAVVNINNGFGAGYVASLINRTNEGAVAQE
jgi:NCAIR mutase (PurE)-related protein